MRTIDPRPSPSAIGLAGGWHPMRDLGPVGLKVRMLLPPGPTAARLGGRVVVGWRGRKVTGPVFFTWDRVLKLHVEIAPIGWLPLDPPNAPANTGTARAA